MKFVDKRKPEIKGWTRFVLSLLTPHQSVLLCMAHRVLPGTKAVSILPFLKTPSFQIPAWFSNPVASTPEDTFETLLPAVLNKLMVPFCQGSAL
jgi:hypothetical protein